ncbi:MAG TPA: inner membrane CreD family protein, partial [Bacteroidia bacterium]|nr:inner membrane CreD family protein [Bacteroidia bacterium]
ISFNLSYLLSAAAIILLISLYAKTIFNNLRLALLFSLVLIILYVFVFSIIQLQDYALLLGSIGLFIVLALVMYLSRKINWYGSEK